MIWVQVASVYTRDRELVKKLKESGARYEPKYHCWQVGYYSEPPQDVMDFLDDIQETNPDANVRVRTSLMR